jgi:hypothetical protein
MQIRRRYYRRLRMYPDDLKTKYTHGELEKMNQQYGYVPPRFMDNMLSAAQQCRK